MRHGAEEWMERAACRGRPTSLFFSEDESDVREAQRICAFCPVRRECLDYAIVNHIPDGVWGGLDERERRRWARQQRIA